MNIQLGRRELIAGAALAAAGCSATARPGPALPLATDEPLYGLIGKMRATPGQRDRLVYYLLDGAANMPGCLSYVAALDPADPDAVWITEAWDSEASHKASLALPAVQAAIAKARPIIAGFDQSHVTQPVGGTGLRG
jgi:quinol monooxygenase YgiN